MSPSKRETLEKERGSTFKKLKKMFTPGGKETQASESPEPPPIGTS